jgi:hypothetical protein
MMRGNVWGDSARQTRNEPGLRQTKFTFGMTLSKPPLPMAIWPGRKSLLEFCSGAFCARIDGSRLHNQLYIAVLE